MTIETLLSVLNTAIKSNSLLLTDPIAGLSWTTDIKTSISTNLNPLTNLSLQATGLKAIQAPTGSVMVNAQDVPSVVVYGSPDSDILNIPKTSIELTLYITPVKPDANDNTVDFTLIVLNKNTGSENGWTPGNSFPSLNNSSIFESFVAAKPASFLLTSFVHDQQWSVGGPANNFSNSFPGLQAGLNCQLPSGLTTEMFPPLQGLFGDLSAGVFNFNGTIDNTQTTVDPNRIAVNLVADLGSENNKTISGNNSPLNITFEAGVQAIPALADDDETEETMASPPQTLLAIQVLLRATIGKIIIQSIIPSSGDTISFSMTGVDNAPVLSLADIIGLFDKSFLSDHMPSSMLQKDPGNKDFFDYIGVLDIGLDLQMPSTGGSTSMELVTGSSAPRIVGILLKVGYAQGAPPIGYQPWFALDSFSVTWMVNNPFPLSGAQPLVLLNGNFELLGGVLEFDASFAKQTTNGNVKRGLMRRSSQPRALTMDASTWVFSINGALADQPPDNTIKLTELFKKFGSATDDFPEIEIDEFSFMAQPEQQQYSIVVGIDLYNFSAYKTVPILQSFRIQVDKNKDDITGSITAGIAVGQAVFDFKAERTDTEWQFSATNEEPFTIGDLATAFGFSYPSYLDSITIKQVSVSYTAPIKAANGSLMPRPADAPASSTFAIIIEAQLPVATELLDITVQYTVNSTTWSFDATLKIGPTAHPDKQLEFTFDATGKTVGGGGSTSPSKETTLVATLSNPSGTPMNISDFAIALGVTPPDLPEALNDIALVSATLEYDTGTNGKGFLFSAVSEIYGQLVFAIVKTGSGGATSWKPFVGLSFKPVLDFGSLPVVGSYIKKIGNFDLEQIQIAGIPIVLTAPDIVELNNLFTNANPAVPTSLIPTVPAGQGLPAEAIFNAVLNVNGDKKPINLVFKSSTSGTNILLPAVSFAGDDGGDTAKIPANNAQQPVGISFGPVHISKFNLAYSDGKLGIDISGDLSLAGIALSFQGLGIKMKFPPKTIGDVSFQLHGLGVYVNKGDLRIIGGFITLDDNFDNFMGMLSITAGTIGIQAYGGYATTTKEPSFFIFANVEVPLGGPPFFFIDGVAGGFGINRRFIMPDFEELPTFPLLPGATSNPLPGNAPNGIEAVTGALTSLAKFIPPANGAYWIAAGLDFSTFEIIQVTAILEVSWGAGFQIGMLASAALSVPEPDEPIAYIQLVFEIDFDSTQGILAIFAEITPASYVFDNACHLTGGFAFYTWYKGEHEGDFLVSIGGYHPAFVKPPWYPAVPRLGMTWDLGILKMSGQSYFALTPHMLMAGLEIKAVFDIKVVSATFDAGFDFLLGWKPFFYTADAYVHISIELHIIFTIEFHVGVDLDIWGPDFGGKAKVDLAIFSFTIHFGSDAPTPPPIPWARFKEMLPNTYPDTTGDNRLKIAMSMATTKTKNESTPFSVSQVILSKGLLQQLSKDPLQLSDELDEKIFNWVINPNDFELLITAGVPCNNFYFNNDNVNAGNAINARNSNSGLTPAAYPGNYVKPNDEIKFYTNQNNNPSEATIFAYDYPKQVSDAWWNQPVQVGPVDIPAGGFNADGSRSQGFASIFNVSVYELISGMSVTKKFENNFVVTLVSKNAAASLWGSQVTAANGNNKLNDAPTVKNTLFGISLSPKLWNPLQTRSIDIYELLYQDGNNMCWPAAAGPAIPSNNFNETISDNGDTMTFAGESGQVTNHFRQLDPGAFANIQAGLELINTLNASYGFDAAMTVVTDAAKLAEPMYKDWIVLASLGEQDAEAVNKVY